MGGEAYAKAVFDQIARDWGMMLYKDSTSFWETILGQKDFGYAGSLCHGWSCGPVQFLTEKVLGVKVLKAGCEEIEISPSLGGLKRCRGVFPTPFGNVKIYHENKDGKITSRVTAPQGVKIVIKEN